MSIHDTTKPPKKRPKKSGTPVMTRLQDDLLDLVDSFRKDQDDLPSRPEAIRRILNDYFISTGKIPFEDDAD